MVVVVVHLLFLIQCHTLETVRKFCNWYLNLKSQVQRNIYVLAFRKWWNAVEFMSFNNALWCPFPLPFLKIWKENDILLLQETWCFFFSFMFGVLQLWIIPKSYPDFNFNQVVYLWLPAISIFSLPRYKVTVMVKLADLPILIFLL